MKSSKLMRRRGRGSWIDSLEARQLLASQGFGSDTPSFPGQEYQIGGRWTQTATNANTGSNGTPITLTWGFVNDGLNIPGFNGEPAAPSVLKAKLNTIYGSQAVWQPIFQSVFDRWSVLTGITYVYQNSDDGASFGSAAGALGVRADVRIGSHPIDGGSNVLAYNFFPNGADMVIDSDDLTIGVGYMSNTSNSSVRLRNVLAHEHGHGLGLNHVDPVTQSKLMEPFVSTLFDGPQFDDILAIQRSYGDPLEKLGGNNTVGTATNVGAVAVGSSNLATNVSINSSADNDWFRFSVADPRTATITLAPQGVTYNQGPQNGATSPFSPQLESNLGFELRAADGTTILSTLNSTAAGVNEVLSNFTLGADTYYIRVFGASNNTQMYNLLISNVAASAAPDLNAISDTGSSSVDNLTRLNNSSPASVLSITLTNVTAGATVQLLYNNTVIGSAVATGSSVVVVTDGLTTLPDGNVTLSGRQIIGANTVNGGFITVAIDTVAPTASTPTYDREITQDITLTFSEAIPTLAASGFSVINNTTGLPRSVDMVVTSGNTATAQFNAVLVNGNYTFSVNNSLTDTAGNAVTNNPTVNFRVLGGDADDNNIVDFQDLLVLAQNYGQPNRTYSQGNYDYTSTVGFNDLLIVAQNFGLSLIQARPISNAASVVAAESRPARATATVRASAPPVRRRATAAVFSDSQV